MAFHLPSEPMAAVYSSPFHDVFTVTCPCFLPLSPHTGTVPSCCITIPSENIAGSLTLAEASPQVPAKQSRHAAAKKEEIFMVVDMLGFLFKKLEKS